jgi:hypothetical protein
MSCDEVCHSNMQQIEVLGEDENSIKKGVEQKNLTYNLVN